MLNTLKNKNLYFFLMILINYVMSFFSYDFSQLQLLCCPVNDTKILVVAYYLRIPFDRLHLPNKLFNGFTF